MENIVKHILQITNVDERGNILAYKILCNLSIDMVADGKSTETVLNYIDTLTEDLNNREINNGIRKNS